MSKITISDSDKKLLLIFFAVLIFAASYFFIFNKNMNKASELETNNATDQTKVEQMEMMEKNIPQVKQQITDLKKKQADIIEKYPVDLTTEKAIWVLQSMEDNSDFHISEITFLMTNPLAAADTASQTTQEDTETQDTTNTEADTQTESGDTDESEAEDSENAKEPVSGYYASIGVKYDASYQGLKEMIRYVNEYPDRITITDFSGAEESESGRLAGNITFNMYYIKGTGKAYIPPEFDGIPKGVLNIFGGSLD